MDALPEDWQAVPNEKEKCEEITRLTVFFETLFGLDIQSTPVQSPAPYCCFAWVTVERGFGRRFPRTSVILTEPLHCYWVVTRSSKRVLLIGDKSTDSLTLHI